eukprot:7017327-Prymnesium_polylepis.1
MVDMHDCRAGFAPEDVAQSIYCNGVGVGGASNSGVSQSSNVYGRARQLRAGGRSSPYRSSFHSSSSYQGHAPVAVADNG